MVVSDPSYRYLVDTLAESGTSGISPFPVTEDSVKEVRTVHYEAAKEWVSIPADTRASSRTLSSLRPSANSPIDRNGNDPLHRPSVFRNA